MLVIHAASSFCVAATVFQASVKCVRGLVANLCSLHAKSTINNGPTCLAAPINGTHRCVDEAGWFV